MDNDPVLTEKLQAQHGILTRADALALGYDDPRISAFIRTGQWRVVRRGAYVPATTWDASSERERHLLKVRAVSLKLGDRVAISHQSAVAVYGLPLDGLDLRQVHITRTDACRARVVGAVHHHVARGSAQLVRLVDGMRVLDPATVVLEVAGAIGLFPAVSVLDAAIQHEYVDLDALNARMAQMRTWPGVSGAPRALALANGKAESVGESHCRLTLYKLGFPAPQLQVVFADGRGKFARVDMYWPEFGLILEFDGRVKYGRVGETTAQTVFDEKVREDRLRALGLEVVRVLWDHLLRPNELRAMMNAAIARAQLRRPAAS